MPEALSTVELRALLPALNTYTWLNAAASTPISEPVAAAQRTHLAETVAQGDLSFPKWAALKEAVRAKVARFIGAQTREVAFTPSTSFGFHVIAELLKARGVNEVLTLESEFPSTTLPMLHRGLTLRGVRARPDGSYPLADIEAALRPSTQAVAVSAVQFSSGFRVDLEGVARLCKDRGLPLAVNAAQGIGQVPLDVAALGASFLAAPSHKWLMGSYGTGLLYLRSDWLEGELPLGGWLSVEPALLWQSFAGARRTDDAQGFIAQGTRFRREASTLEGGVGPWLGVYGLDAALDLHERLGRGTALPHNLALQQRLRAGLRSRGFSPNAPDDPAFGSGICVVPVRGGPEDAVRALIRERKVVTTPRGGGLRISTHVYNDENDVDALLAGIDALGIKPA